MGSGGDADSLVGHIYEAAVAAEEWPSVLQRIADSVGARGGAYVLRSPEHASIICSPAIEQMGRDYAEAGWLDDTEVAAPLYAELYPGFRVESDYRTPDEIAALPVHREFFDPRGLIAGAATVFQGPLDEILHVTMEGFPSHDASRAARPFLDLLRPHLGRAMSLTAQFRHRHDRGVVNALELAGVGAAIVNTSGRLRAANDRFVTRLGQEMVELRARLHFTSPFLETQFRHALERSRIGAVASIGLRRDEEEPIVIHLIPIRGKAKDRLDADGVLMLLAESNNPSLPAADLLRVLFDLTPAEATLTRSLLEGRTLADVAKARGVSAATVKTQLKSVFGKTGMSRQVDLFRLIRGLAP